MSRSFATAVTLAAVLGAMGCGGSGGGEGPTPPASPTGVSAAAGDGRVTVSWTASPGADSYNLYWSASASVSKASGTKVAGATSGGAITALANGTPYWFVVTAVNAGGESADSSPAASATPLPPIAAAPTGVTAEAGDGQVTLTWTASSGADSYDVYWSTSAGVSKGTGTKVAGATSGAVIDGLVNGTPHWFVVIAVNLGGESAESSPAASATPLPPIPAAPSAVAAVAGDGEVTVTWAASSRADSYNLYWSTSASVSKATGIPVTGATSGVAVTGLVNGTTYHFVVTAVNLAGESADSTPVASATPLPPIPAAPTAVSAVAGDGRVTVSWTGSTGATSYDLYYSTSPGVSKATGTKASGATSGAAVTGLANGTRYYFVVTAVNLGGESAESSPDASATPLPPIPAAPTAVAAVAGDGEVVIAWTGSSGADSYNLYWSTSASASKATGIPVTGATSGAAVTGLVNGTTYYFVVTSVNLGGESAESSPVASATPLPPIPAAPTGVSAGAGDGQVTISWTAVPRADSYDVYWSTSPGVSKATGTKVTGATSGGAVTGLANGTPYYFVVTAVNLGGEGPESSPAVSATPLPPIPAAPTAVSAVAGDGQATVSWTGSSGATSYDLYYSTSPSVSKATGTKVTGATSGAAVTGLVNGTSYWFVVTSVNLGGESAESSPAASATPLPPIPAAPTAVSAVAGDQSATVSWTASPRADSYNVYWSTSADVSKATGTKVTGVASGGAVTGLVNGITCYFVVTAVNLAGEGAESTPAASAMPVPPIPAAPTGVTATAGDGQVTVAWTASPGATSYDLYWSTSSSVSKSNGTKVTGATSGGAVTGLTNGTGYYFVVTAVNLGGESAESSPAASATPVPPVPAAPTGVTVVAGIGQVTVSWTAASGATSYNLYYSSSASVSKANGTKVTGATAPYTLGAQVAAKALYLVVTAVNLGGESADSSPAVAATPLPNILGKFSYAGAGNVEMGVDATAKRVYVSGSVGQSGLIRIDATNPTSMSQVALPNGGGIAVDSKTGRYATTNGYGATLYVYNSNDALYDVEAITGCGGSMDADTGGGRFFVSSQCSDHLAVYSQASASLVANVTSNGVGSSVVFDPSTGNALQNLTPNHATGNVVAPLVVTPAYATSTPITGFVRAADGALGHLFVAGNDGAFRVLDSTTFATLQTFASTAFTSVAADPSLAVFYAAIGPDVRVYDGNTYALLTTLTLPATVQNMKLVPGDDRLYVLVGTGGGSGQLYVIQTRAAGSGPAAPTGVTAIAKPNGAAVSWSASPGARAYNLYYSTSPAVSKTNGARIIGAVSGRPVVGITPGTPYYFVVTAVDATGESAESAPVATATPLTPPIVLGTYAYAGAGGGDMAVDSTRRRVYVSGSIAQSGLIRIDATNPASMTQVGLPYGGGIAADSQTGRYATTNGWGATLFVFNVNDSLYDVEPLSGCPGAMDSDPTRGRFFVSSQCDDHLAVYGEGEMAILANVGSAGTGSNVVFDPFTGSVLQNLTPNYAAGYVTAPLRITSGFATSVPFTGYVQAADAALPRLYVGANDGSFQVRDAVTYATLKSFPSTSFTSIATNPSTGVFYAATGATVRVYDTTSYVLLTTVTLSGNVQNMKMVPGDDRLYVIDGTRLYVIRTR